MSDTDLIREALEFGRDCGARAGEYERMEAALAALARVEAGMAAMRERALFWQTLHEEESWPYEWQVATALKEERDQARAALATLAREMKYIGEFAAAHHHDQESHVWLHALTIDIPDVVDKALALPAVRDVLTNDRAISHSHAARDSGEGDE